MNTSYQCLFLPGSPAHRGRRVPLGSKSFSFNSLTQVSLSLSFFRWRVKTWKRSAHRYANIKTGKHLECWKFLKQMFRSEARELLVVFVFLHSGTEITNVAGEVTRQTVLPRPYLLNADLQPLISWPRPRKLKRSSAWEKHPWLEPQTTSSVLFQPWSLPESARVASIVWQ